MQHFVGHILIFLFTPWEVATVWRKRNIFGRNVTLIYSLCPVKIYRDTPDPLFHRSQQFSCFKFERQLHQCRMKITNIKQENVSKLRGLPDFHLVVILTNARVNPQQALPTETVVQLGEVRSFTRTVRTQFCAQDTQHGFPTLRGRASTLFCHTIHCTRLFIVLQPTPAKHKLELF
jgi:hypothetical protein